MKYQYSEILVERKPSDFVKLLRTISCVLAISSFILGLFISNLWLLAATVVFALLFLFYRRRSNIEYEYFVMDNEFTISKIYNKSRRKEIVSLSGDNIEVITPKSKVNVNEFNAMPVTDCSANDKVNEAYALIYYTQEIKKCILLQLTPDDVESLKQQLLGKVW